MAHRKLVWCGTALLLLPVVVIVLGSSRADAGPELLTNPSFEIISPSDAAMHERLERGSPSRGR